LSTAEQFLLAIFEPKTLFKICTTVDKHQQLLIIVHAMSTFTASTAPRSTQSLFERYLFKPALFF